MDCDHVRNTASTHQDYRCEEAAVEAAHTAILQLYNVRAAAEIEVP